MIIKKLPSMQRIKSQITLTKYLISIMLHPSMCAGGNDYKKLPSMQRIISQLTLTKYLISIMLHPSKCVGGNEGTRVALFIRPTLFFCTFTLALNKLNDCFFSWYLGCPDDHILSE